VGPNDGKLYCVQCSASKWFNPDDANNANQVVLPMAMLMLWYLLAHFSFSGDHRQVIIHMIHATALGYIPFYDVVGPVSVRIYPFTGDSRLFNLHREVL